MSWLTVLLLSAFTLGAPQNEQCPKRGLERKDCLLKQGAFQVQVSKLKITWNDGTWTNIADIPVSGDDYQWEKIELSQLSGRWMLQMWVWDGGKGEAKVQSLHWLVGEMKDRKFTTALNQIVRRREVHATQPVSYTYDKLTPHSLVVVRKGSGKSLHWTVDKQSGDI
jgi:hypothetical protein